MKLFQTYQPTDNINQLIIKIEAHRQTLSLLNPPESKLKIIRAKSLLHSGVYSAAIEGNPLTPSNHDSSDNDLAKLEINNLLTTLTWIYTHSPILDTPLVRELHRQTMQNLLQSPGHFRTEQSAIFNTAGVAIYLTPPPNEIKPLLTDWLTQHQETSYPQPIAIAISHYQFEKIHPFLDGNGRVGRLITSLLLHQQGYDLGGLISLDSYLHSHRHDYYDTLTPNIRDITPFIEFFLTALAATQSQALSQLAKQSSQEDEPLILPPRREELLNIIKDHPQCSFDQLHHRFMGTPASTLHYDLQQLQKAKLIQKIGSTRGALYQAN